MMNDDWYGSMYLNISLLNLMVWMNDEYVIWMIYVSKWVMRMDQCMSLFNSIMNLNFMCGSNFNVLLIYLHFPYVPPHPQNFPKIWGNPTRPPCVSPHTHVSPHRSLGGTLENTQKVLHVQTPALLWMLLQLAADCCQYM